MGKPFCAPVHKPLDNNHPRRKTHKDSSNDETLYLRGNGGPARIGLVLLGRLHSNRVGSIVDRQRWAPARSFGANL